MVLKNMKNIKKEKVNNIRTSLIDKIRLDPFYSNIKSEKHINDGLLFTFESNTVKEIFVPLMEYRIKCFIGFTMNGTSEDSKFLIFKIRISTDPNIKSLLYLESKITSIIEVLTNEENLYKIKKTNYVSGVSFISLEGFVPLDKNILKISSLSFNI